MAGSRGFLRSWKRLRSRSGSQFRCNPLPEVITMRTTLHRRNVTKRFVERKIFLPKRMQGRATGGGNLAKDIGTRPTQNKGSEIQSEGLNHEAAYFSVVAYHNDKPQALCSSRSPPSSWSPPPSSFELMSCRFPREKVVNSNALQESTGADTLKFNLLEEEPMTSQTLIWNSDKSFQKGEGTEKT